MKVLTLKQPWATLVAEGIKQIEFRSWKTNYRGKILIHAGTSIDKEAMIKFKDLNLSYPTARIVAETSIVDCIELDEKTNKDIVSQNNVAYGTKYRDGYAWILSNTKKINSNKIIKGKLGIWNIELGDLYDNSSCSTNISR